MIWRWPARLDIRLGRPHLSRRSAVFYFAGLIVICFIANCFTALIAVSDYLWRETKGMPENLPENLPDKPECHSQGCQEDNPVPNAWPTSIETLTVLGHRPQEHNKLISPANTLWTSQTHHRSFTPDPNLYNIAEFVNKSCSRLGHWPRLSRHQQYILLSHLLYDDTRRLIYCSIPKAGSSNWKRLFLALRTNISQVPQRFQKFDNRVRGGPLKFLYHLSRKGIAYRLKHYLRFMIIRNPAERLASVYFHKFTNFSESVPFKAKYSAAIRRASQANASRQSVSGTASKDVITFQQFVHYLVNLRVDDMNEHWLPAVDLCQPCVVNYQFVGRFEQLPQSAQALLHLAGLGFRISYPKQPMFYRGPPVHLDEIELYDKLPPELRAQFWKLYRRDFELFNYSFMN